VDQRPFPRAREYRRGIEEKDGRKVWQKLWHFHPDCPSYPAKGFAIKIVQPSDDDLCARCHGLDRGPAKQD
jgi:hypothetical protein